MRRSSTATLDEDRKLIEESLRTICAKFPNTEIAAQDIEDERIILDFVYGGIRCLLIRTQNEENQHLSPREQEIVRLVAAGHPNKVIAAVLDISYWTVSTHLRRIFAKLGVTSRAAMVARVRNSSTWRDESLR